MAELALDDVERYTLSSHLDRVGVSQLVWCEAATHANLGGQVMQRRPGCAG